MGAASQRTALPIRQSARPQGRESCAFAWLRSALRVGWDGPRHAGLPAPPDFGSGVASSRLPFRRPRWPWGPRKQSRLGLSACRESWARVTWWPCCWPGLVSASVSGWTSAPSWGGRRAADPPHRVRAWGSVALGSVEKGRGAPFTNTAPRQESGRKDGGLCPSGRPRRGRPVLARLCGSQGRRALPGAEKQGTCLLVQLAGTHSEGWRAWHRGHRRPQAVPSGAASPRALACGCSSTWPGGGGSVRHGCLSFCYGCGLGPGEVVGPPPGHGGWRAGPGLGGPWLLIPYLRLPVGLKPSPDLGSLCRGVFQAPVGSSVRAELAVAV